MLFLDEALHEMKGFHLLSAAQKFAAERHAGQRYGDEPYTRHLADVEQVLRRFGVQDWELLAAAWLHDVVEDTGTTLNEVRERFDGRVAGLVWAVTNEPGKNRRERAGRTYPKIAALPGATLIKLADRIANLTHALRTGNHVFLQMYRSEQRRFRRALYVPGEHEALWAHLRSLLTTTVGG